MWSLIMKWYISYIWDTNYAVYRFSHCDISLKPFVNVFLRNADETDDGPFYVTPTSESVYTH